MSLRRAFALAYFVCTLSPAAASAQAAPGWNDARTLDLITRAAERRTTEVVDSALQSYQADARGYVYFLLDSPELDRQSLVRTDQVAVEVYWRAPNQIRQRVVGWREQKELPITRLHYYLDRLTVVLDSYGEAIVIADGENVRDVPHPVAPGGPSTYDYQLVDSLTLRLPGVEGPVTVHEVQVRPKDSSVPGVIGKVYLDAASGALVRMTFTFTPSSYVDPRLDYINVTLSNGLWLGRFWLPHEQSLDIRREIPELDLPFGTVIRTRMRVGGYVFNEQPPEAERVFAFPAPVTFAPPAARESFPFEQPIDAEWRVEGLAAPADIEEMRREAIELVRERAISGLQTRRLGFGSVSDVVRYNRADGLLLGAGIGFPVGPLSARVHGGWAFGAGHPKGRIDVGSGPNITGSLYLNRTADVGGFTLSSRAANTLSTFVLGEDWTDPFHASGVTAAVRVPTAGLYSFGVRGTLEHQRPAELTTTYSLFGDADEMRPVLATERGTLLSGELSVRRDATTPAGSGWWAELRGGPATLRGQDDDFTFGRLAAETGLSWSSSRRRAALELEGAGRMTIGAAPTQELLLIGGRGTLPGYSFRAFGGDRALTTRALAAADIRHPFVRGRLSGYLGWANVSADATPSAGVWRVQGSEGVKASVGIGVGVFYDLLHLDVVRGLSSGGGTQLMIEFQPEFWGFL